MPIADLKPREIVAAKTVLEAAGFRWQLDLPFVIFADALPSKPRTEEKVSSYEQAVLMNPKNWKAMAELGAFYYAKGIDFLTKGDRDSAEEWLVKGIERARTAANEVTLKVW